MEIYYKAPDRILVSVTTQEGTLEQGFDGSRGWIKSKDELRELGSGELENFKVLFSQLRVLQINMPYPKMAVVGRDKIGEQEVYVLETTGGVKRQKLFFDIQTGLLLRRVEFTECMVGVIPEQIDFDDYREVDGVKAPFSIRASFVDPWIGSVRKFTEINHNTPFDNKKFDMPQN
jgi:hypothetical protein